MRYRTLTQPWLNLASTLLQHCLNLASALPQLHHDMTVFVTSTETEIPQAKTIIHLIYIYYRRAPALYIHCCNNNIPLWQIAHMWWHSRILDTLESLYAIAYIYSHSEFAFRNPYKSQQYMASWTGLRWGLVVVVRILRTKTNRLPLGRSTNHTVQNVWSTCQEKSPGATDAR